MARTRFVHIVNRTTGPLDCTWDGVPIVLAPGYKRVQEPVMDPAHPDLQKLDKNKNPMFTEKFVPVDEHGNEVEGPNPPGQYVEYYEAEGCKRQHPIMGTSDPNSADARDGEFLVGVVEWGDDIDHVEQSDAIENINRSLLSEDRQNIVVRDVAGTRRKPDPKAVTDRKIKANKRRAFTDMRLTNPTGMEIRGQINPGEPR